MIVVDPQPFYKTLCNPDAPIIDRYAAVFELKNLKTEEAVKLMLDSYAYLGQSQLMKHQLVYTLGQIDSKFYPLIKQFLYSCVGNKDQLRLVRHQAAEAIANYFDEEAIPMLESYLKCGVQYVEQTCLLAIRKIKNKHSQLYGLQYSETREPAAPFSQQEFQTFLKQNNLQQIYNQNSFIGVLEQPLDLVTKYRILYLMRNINTDKVKVQLCKLLSLAHFKSQSALFKHEVCFVIGQIGLDAGEQESLIRECIQNQEEEDIVRHEALAAVASQSKDEAYLQRFANHPSLIIKESALVAIGQIKYWKS